MVRAMRQSKKENYMDFAEVAAKRSHDAETQVGAILVKNDSGAIVATGFNGFVRGAADSVLPNTRPDKYQFMMHAEQNIISHCCRHGISTENTVLYCTMTPCQQCARMMWQCGIKAVYAKNQYKDFNETRNMKDLPVVWTITDEGFTYMEFGL